MTGMDVLLGAVQELSMTSRLSEVQQVVKGAARELAECDGATFVLRDGDQCFYADEDAIAPLWKGLRFPLETCISGWSMLHREAAVISDIYADPRVPHDAYRPTFVKSLVMTPIRSMAPIGAIGAYWAEVHRASSEEVALLGALADATSLALEKVTIHQELEQEVLLAKEAHRLAQADELTGLLNRRGFSESVEEIFAASTGGSAAVAFVDINGLKRVNDVGGHGAGDRLLQEVAATLLSAVRAGDVVGRVGGDEFAVCAPGMDPASLRDRLLAALDGRAAVGSASLDSADDVYDALLAADAHMYSTKPARSDEPVA